VVTTLAGLAGNAGSEDGTNSAARFTRPCGVALDSAGSLYVADCVNCTIRKVTPVGTNWVVTTLAGLGGTNASGNPLHPGSADGTNSAARFNWPYGVAVDTNGNVYVGDQGNHKIRKVTPVGTNWVVTTLAGLAGSSGSTDGTGSAARFNYPRGVAVDSAGNVYVSDSQNDTIRKVAPVGTNWVVTTLAGLAGYAGSADGTNSTARFSNPLGMAVDSATNLYVADCFNGTIRKVAPVGTNWVVRTLAGLASSIGSVDGTGSAARFNFPCGVAVDSAGNLYVSDSKNNTIRRGFAASSVGVSQLGTKKRTRG
jgi:sugar lactone lactonase YvrE